MVFDSAHHHGSVALAHLRYHDADGETALRTQRARKEIRAVIELSRGGENPVLGVLRNRRSHGRLIDHEGNGSGRKTEMISQFLETNRLLSPRSVFPAILLSWLPRHGRSLAQPEFGGKQRPTSELGD